MVFDDLRTAQIPTYIRFQRLRQKHNHLYMEVICISRSML